MQELCAFLCVSLLKRLPAYPKAIIIKMKNKINCESVWWIFYPNKITLCAWEGINSKIIVLWLCSAKYSKVLFAAVFQEIAGMGFKWIEAHDGNTETSRMLQTIKIILSQ